MIPKIIHYIWFGGNPLSEIAEKCIASWKQYCPDYEIKRWDESVFFISEAPAYVREAYSHKKWAFVSDYVRLYALYTYGGIYMDTDVEVVASLDSFLNERCFSGFETPKTIPTGIMGSEKQLPLIGLLLKQYDDRHFVKEDGSIDMTTNVTLITNELLKHGFIPNNTYQVVAGMSLYPKDFFCPKDYHTGIIEITKNTATIHHFNGSWKDEKEKKAHDRNLKIYKKYGIDKGNRIIRRKSFIVKIKTFIKRIIRKK